MKDQKIIRYVKKSVILDTPTYSEQANAARDQTVYIQDSLYHFMNTNFRLPIFRDSKLVDLDSGTSHFSK